MRRVTSFSITTALVAFTVLASGQSPAPQAVAQASRPAVVKTHAKPTLSKADSDAIVAAIKPAYAAFKADKNEKKLVAATSSLKGEAKWAAMALVATAMEQARATTSQMLTRYTIESATVDKIKAGKVPDCELTVEMTLRVRRLGPVPQGRVEITGSVIERVAWLGSQPQSVEVNAIFPPQDANQPLVTVPLVVSKLPNRVVVGGQCSPPGFAGALTIVGGVASPYFINLSEGELTVEVAPPPGSGCNLGRVRCPVGSGACVDASLFDAMFPLVCLRD